MVEIKGRENCIFMGVENGKEIEHKFEEYPYASHRPGSRAMGLCSLAEANLLGLFSYHYLNGTPPEMGYMVREGERVALAFHTQFVNIDGFGSHGFGWEKFFVVRSNLNEFEGRIAIPYQDQYRVRFPDESFDMSVQELSYGKAEKRRFQEETLRLIYQAHEKAGDCEQRELTYRELFDYLVLDFESRYLKNAWSLR